AVEIETRTRKYNRPKRSRPLPPPTADATATSERSRRFAGSHGCVPPFECALPRATTSGRTGDAKAALGKRATLPARGVVERRTLCSGTAEEAEAPVASLTLETGEVGTGPDEPPPPL